MKSLKKKIIEKLKAFGFRKILTQKGVNIFVSEIDSETSISFKFTEEKSKTVPLIFYGLFNERFQRALSKVEKTEDLGVYSMTLEVPLNFEVDKSGKIEVLSESETLNAIEAKATQLTESAQQILREYDMLFAENKEKTLILPSAECCFGDFFTYYAFIYSMSKGRQDIDVKSVELELERCSNNVLRHRLTLLMDFLIEKNVGSPTI